MTDPDPTIDQWLDDHITFEQPELPPVSPDAVLRRSLEVAWIQVADEVVVHRAANATSYVLSKAAALLWQCLDGESTLELIFADFADVFEVPVERIVDDFVPVVAEWMLASIVEEVGDGQDLATAG